MVECGRKGTSYNSDYQILTFSANFKTTVFGLKTCFKSVKRPFWADQKNYKNSPKNANFDPHAAKALNKKLWYLKDQQVVATTGPTNHRAAQKVVAKTQKDHHLPQQGNLPAQAVQMAKKASR